MNHKYSTIALIFLITVSILVSLAIGLTSQDIDEICDVDTSVLYRYNGTWVCGNITGSTSYITSINSTYFNVILGKLNPIISAWSSGTFNASKYYNKTQSDSRYLQSYIETDPIWTSEKSNYYTKTEDLKQDIQFTTQTYMTDFMTTTIYAPFLGTLISSGTITTQAGKPNNPGWICFLDSTTANGGVNIATNNNAISLAGNESAQFILSVRNISGRTGGSSKNTTTIYMGFQDATSSVEPIDGCYFKIRYNVEQKNWSALCRNNSVSFHTRNNFTGANEREILKFTINITDALKSTRKVNFTIWNVTSGLMLWSKGVTNKIPIGVGRETGFGIIATEDKTDSGKIMLCIDYMEARIKRVLNR